MTLLWNFNYFLLFYEWLAHLKISSPMKFPTLIIFLMNSIKVTLMIRQCHHTTKTMNKSNIWTDIQSKIHIRNALMNLWISSSTNQIKLFFISKVFFYKVYHDTVSNEHHPRFPSVKNNPFTPNYWLNVIQLRDWSSLVASFISYTYIFYAVSAVERERETVRQSTNLWFCTGKTKDMNKFWVLSIIKQRNQIKWKVLNKSVQLLRFSQRINELYSIKQYLIAPGIFHSAKSGILQHLLH